MTETTPDSSTVLLLLIAGLLSLVPATIHSASAGPDLSALEKDIDRGKYDALIKTLRTHLDNRRAAAPRATHLLLRALRVTGQYEEGLDRARTALESLQDGDEPDADDGFVPRAELRTDLAHFRMRTGDYDRALEIVNQVVKQHKPFLRARWIRVRLHRLTGAYDKIESDARYAIRYRKNHDISDAHRILYHSRIRWLYATWHGKTKIVKQVINDLARANDIDPKNPRILTFWADCYLEKRHRKDAAKTYKDALKINKTDPAALTGRARFLLRRRTNRKIGNKKAMNLLDRALKTNDRYVPALVAKAKQQLVERNHEAAWKTIETGMDAAGHSPFIRSIKAAYHYVNDETDAFEAAREKVLNINPRFGTLYALLAEIITQKHQYPKAQTFYRKANKLNPHLWTVTRDRGINATRLGKEKKGKKLIQEAFDNNPFDVLSYNYLELLDKFDSKFKTYHIPGYTVRIHRREAAYAKPYVFRLLRRARTEMQKRYGLTLDEPTLVEIFEDHRDFSVRTVGMQGLGALGACFGTVTTALSPLAQDQMGGYNWGAILWHEMGHAYALQLSNMNVPRWFTEGLSVYEESKPYDAWRREMEPKLFKAWKLDKLPSIKKMDRGEGGGLISYYLYGSVIIDYIVKEHGFDHVVKILKAYGRDPSTENVFRDVLDTSLSTFQDRVDDYMEERFGSLPLRAPLKPKRTLGNLAGVDLEDIKKTLNLDEVFDTEQASYDELIKAGRLAAARGKTEKARSYLEKARGKDPSRPMAYALLADFPYRREEWSNAVEEYEKAHERGISDIQSLLRYARSLEERERRDDAIAVYEQARRTYPSFVKGNRNPYLRLFELYRRKGEPRKMLKRLRGYVDRAHKDFRQHMKLAKLYRTLDRWKQVRTILERLVYVNYRDLRLHSYLAEAYGHLGNWTKKRTEHLTTVALLRSMDQADRSTEDLLVKHYVGAAKASKQLDQIERARREARKALDVNSTAHAAIKFLRSLE